MLKKKYSRLVQNFDLYGKRVCGCFCCLCWFAVRWFHFKMICKVHSLVRIHFITSDYHENRVFNFCFVKMASNIFFCFFQKSLQIYGYLRWFCKVCINMNIFDIFCFFFDWVDRRFRSISYISNRVCLCKCTCFV